MTKFYCTVLAFLLVVFTPVSAAAAAKTQEAGGTGPEVLSLKNCLDMAYQNSQSIKIATENASMAKEAVREAGSKFWPVGAYEYGYQQASQGELWFINPVTMEWQRKPDKGYSGTVTLTQPLYSGGKLSGNMAIAKLQLAAALENQRKAKQQLTFSVKEAYYGVGLAEQMALVAQNSYRNLELHVEQVQNLRRVGTGSKFDLLQAQVQRDRLKPAVIKAQNQLALAKSSLAMLIGMDKSCRYTVNNDLPNFPIPDTAPGSLETVVAESWQKRPEMCQIRQLTQIGQEQLKIARAGYKPDLALSAKYKAEGEAASVKDDTTWILTVGLSGVFFDGLGTLARVNQAKAGIKVIQAQEKDLKDRISLEAEQSLQTLTESLETIHANQASIDLAKEALRMTQIRFGAGLATTMDVMDGQLALDQALTGYYEGIYQYITGSARLDLVMGRDS